MWKNFPAPLQSAWELVFSIGYILIERLALRLAWLLVDRLGVGECWPYSRRVILSLSAINCD